MPHRLTRTLPYVVVLAIAGFLYLQLGNLSAPATTGLNAAVWPKAILALTALACGYEIIRGLLVDDDSRKAIGVLETIVEEAGAESAPQPQPTPEKRYTILLLGGIGITVAYVALIEALGFFLCTFVYLAGFMMIGRFRRLRLVVPISLLGSLAFAFVFMKVVYVSLPLGRGPFQEVSLLLMRVMGVR